jgi:hypothetical protein
MAVRVFLVEDQKPMQVLVSDLLECVGGFELAGAAASETSATYCRAFPGRVAQAEAA